MGWFAIKLYCKFNRGQFFFRYKNGKEIKPSPKIRITDLGEGGFSLLLTDVGKEDEGVYKIEAEKDGVVAKSEAKLGVQGFG